MAMSAIAQVGFAGLSTMMSVRGPLAIAASATAAIFASSTPSVKPKGVTPISVMCVCSSMSVPP